MSKDTENSTHNCDLLTSKTLPTYDDLLCIVFYAKIGFSIFLMPKKAQG